MEENTRVELRFYIKDTLNDIYKTKTVINNIYNTDVTELDQIVEKFKDFLRYCGYPETTVSAIQCLEDDEWKDVLTKYGEWDEHKEEVYQARKKSSMYES